MSIFEWSRYCHSCWQIRSDRKEKNAVMSFTVTDEPTFIDLTVSEVKKEPVKLAVVCRDGQLHLFEHILYGTALVYHLQESIEERLEALDIDVSKVKTPGGLPQTDSFAVLLVQGLESNDAEILNRVLNTRKEHVIKNTVARMPIHAVIPLLHELMKRLQGNPYSASLMVRWLKSVFTQHASYLSTLPDLIPQLGMLYQLMESRVKTLQKLSRLHGRLYILVTQVAASEKAQDVADVNQTAKLVYEDESSEEEGSDDEMIADRDSDVSGVGSDLLPFACNRK
ncbi:hypothetical protein Q9233_005582 [Columba guinea]|nr:hypothetical protein Q9233_005582 [Columba guinea]